jgi:hypothetical protein
VDVAVWTENVATCLRAMRSGGWSRNRHFEEHQTPAATRARQLLKLLQSIERDLRRGGTLVGAERDGAMVTLRTHNASLHLTRTLRVPAEDFSLMAEVSPALRTVENS